MFLTTADLDRVRKIHERYYGQEFDLPRFDTFINSFNVNDVCYGGIRPIAECVAITDLSKSVKVRKKALLEFLKLCSVSARLAGYDQLHAFVQDENWEEILKKYDFRTCKGNALVLDV